MYNKLKLETLHLLAPYYSLLLLKMSPCAQNYGDKNNQNKASCTLRCTLHVFFSMGFRVFRCWGSFLNCLPWFKKLCNHGLCNHGKYDLKTLKSNTHSKNTYCVIGQRAGAS